jgi:Ser/Thr protein kinase RdoA (MazF antagonist)
VSGEYSADVVADLRQMVAKGLVHWGLPDTSSLTLLNLSENATFEMRDPLTGREMILRVHRVGYSSAQEIGSELAWIRALQSSGTIETASPLPTLDGELVKSLVSPAGHASRFAVAFEKLAGKEPDVSDDAVTVAWFARLGEVTARMHAHARAWLEPAEFRRRRWDLTSMVGPQPIWGPWRAGLGLDVSGMRVIEQALELITQRLTCYGSSAVRFGLIHADLRLANLLIDGERLRIIDFDDCGFGWFVYDFATAVSFIEHLSVVPALLRAWLAGYDMVNPLSLEERMQIPTFVVLRRILLTAWLASHSEVPLARQLGVEYTRSTVEIAQQLLDGRFLILE